MKNFIDIRFSGKNFSPGKLRELSGLPVETIVEAGEIGKKGRYKGKITPYGLGTLSVEKFNTEALTKCLDQLLIQKLILDNANVEEMVIDFDANTTGLGSFNFSPDLLKKIFDLNARLELNNYKPEGRELYKENVSSTISVSLKSLEAYPKAEEFLKKWKSARKSEKKQLEQRIENLLSMD